MCVLHRSYENNWFTDVCFTRFGYGFVRYDIIKVLKIFIISSVCVFKLSYPENWNSQATDMHFVLFFYLREFQPHLTIMSEPLTKNRLEVSDVRPRRFNYAKIR